MKLELSEESTKTEIVDDSNFEISCAGKFSHSVFFYAWNAPEEDFLLTYQGVCR